MQPVIQTYGLCKKYKKAEVLHDFNITVERGHICGLIGPNGAGKTTIIKILAGLIAPSRGDMVFFGNGDNLDENRRRMSFMIEAPMILLGMTARENLAYIRYLRGYPDEKRIDEVLELVGLSDTGDKKAAKFSLGMKQRLGIGMALLTRPEVLVLDEPVNGLDPEGIVDVRRILQRLSDEENVTILISSHILAELAELCTDFSIINKGNLIENISRDKLHDKCKSHVTLRTDDEKKTAFVLENTLGIHSYKVMKDGEIHIFERLDDVGGISRAVTQSGLVVQKLCEEGTSLEEYYMEKVGEQHE